MRAIEGAGYEGTELGPPGYLGDQATLRPRLEQHHLALVGGYIPIRFSEPEHWDEDLTAMSGTLDLFAAGGGDDAKAKAVLADAGSDERTRFPGRAASDRSIGLDDAGWQRLAEGVTRAANWRVAAASSPPSTTTRRRSSRRPGKSSASSSSPMSDCCSTRDTSRSAAATRPQRCATGATASTTCTSRMCTTTCSQE